MCKVFATCSTSHRVSSTGKGSRLDQLTAWKPDVTLMDESHSAKNASGEPEDDEDADSNDKSDEGGIFGAAKASKAGAAVVDMDKRLPDARIVYMSATAFTDKRNLAYAGRLGLWGPATPFKNFQDFNVQIDRGGLPAMELVAKELKANGRSLARQISFKGVDYNEREAKLTPTQRAMYDAASAAWLKILDNIDLAISATTGGSENNAKSEGAARARAMSQFWSTNQRFYRSLITAMKIPTAIEEIEKALEAEKSVFTDLVNTGEAEQTRQLAKAATSNTALEDLDMSAKQSIVNFLDTSFPIPSSEYFKDPETGAVSSRPVLGPDGLPLVNQEALAIREYLKRELGKIQCRCRRSTRSSTTLVLKKWRQSRAALRAW